MRTRIKKILFIFCLLLAMFAVAHWVLAAGVDTGLSYGAGTGLGNEDPRIIAARVIRIALGFLGIIAVGLIIYAGWLWMTAAGEADKIERAKKILIGAVIGLLICLASFAIASFILSRLLEATGVGPDGTVCDPPCSGGTPYCCQSSCSSNPCGPPISPGSNVFSITSTIPSDQQSAVVRNVVVEAFFNKAIADTVDRATLDKNFKVEKIAEITPADGKETAASPGEVTHATREFANGRWAITFQDNDACRDERNTANCFPAWSKFRVTINGASGIIAVGGQSLNCAPGTLCSFVFSTSNLIDTGGPTAGIAPAQMCQDDGSLTAIPDANLVSGWANDDVGVGSLGFCSQKQGDTTENCFPNSVKAGGLGQTSLSQSYKYDTKGYQLGADYVFRVKANDVAGRLDKAEFTTKMRPGHCCNGVKDGNETDIDCGGGCGACAGSACASDMSVPGTCDNNLCASQFCTTQNSSPAACVAAGYVAGTPTCCLCQQPPIITGVTPAGGFCKNSINQPCLVDSDCGMGNTCDVSTPNGAPGNIITIHGKNFGVVTSLLENVLSNVDFEQGTVGGVPTKWRAGSEKHATSTISQAENRTSSGKQSVWIHQDKDQAFPGTCSETMCKDLNDFHKIKCNWLPGSEAGKGQCSFPQVDACHRDVSKLPVIYKEDEQLCYGNGHWAMWAWLAYDVSKLKWQEGEKYLIEFYYKGHNAEKVPISLAYFLGSPSQCILLDSDWGRSHCRDAVNGTAGATGHPTCVDQPDYCCVQAGSPGSQGYPHQRKCYSSFKIGSIPAGDYQDWTRYSTSITYTQAMAELVNSQGERQNEIGITIGENPTVPNGTDFYIDDFRVAKIPVSGNVIFLGAAGADDDAFASFPSDFNRLCASTWQDDQITVVVPGDAKNGPIKVTAENGLFDTTNDDNLPKIPDFLVNTINRPGICLLTPDHGKLDDLITYQGLKLSGASPYFGNLNGKVAGAEPIFSEQAGTTKVPNITAGRTTSFVTKTINKVEVASNYLNFTKDQEPYIGPLISSFEPKSGAVGQYVTIHGRGFGAAKGSSEVYFGDSVSGTKANYDFPEVCANSVWSNDQVIVKVPAGLTVNMGYKISMKIGNWPEINTNPAVFTVNTTLAPSLCKIEPIIGQANSQISLKGEHFGARDSGKIKFQLNHDQFGTAITFWDKEGTADEAVTTVHQQAASGPVNVVQFKGHCTSDQECETANGKGWICRLSNGGRECELVGNGLNFTVGVCSKKSDCGADSKVFCCSVGTPYSGQCKTGGNEQAACFPAYKSCVYQWDFSTLRGREGDPCDANPATAQCEADDDKCDTNNGLVCDPTTCKCKTAASLESCSGYGLNQCFDSHLCPNSPGNCSAYAGGRTIDTGVGCNNNACLAITKCKGAATEPNLCTYSVALNKCKKNSASCDLNISSENSGITDINGKPVEKKCGLIDSKSVWYYDSSQSCISGWTKSVDGSKCLGGACATCVDDFSCLEENEVGVCAANRLICPVGSNCSNNKCVRADSAACQCCCQKSQNTPAVNPTGNPSCCSPLICGDTCGSGGDFGKCIGCAKVGAATDQAAHNAACNCSGTTGRYCDVSAAGGQGACVDCGQITTASNCTDWGIGTCCVDNKNKDACVGGTDIYSANSKNYCSYYSCGTGNQAKVCKGPQEFGDYRTADCDQKCQNNIGQLSCSGYGNQCAASYFCPNSPGNCSAYAGGKTVEVGSCDFSCNNFAPCKENLCAYQSDINKCVKKKGSTDSSCALPRQVNYTIGNITATSTASCLNNQWVMTVTTSCPGGWTNIGGGRCTGPACQSCNTGFECLAEAVGAASGVCAIDQLICPTGSTCNASGKCAKTDSAACECCCRKDYANQDCCNQLKCEGACGAETNPNNTKFGLCTGCANVSADQAVRNAACNCSGTSGKYCDTTVAGGQGVCLDCAQLSTDSCSTAGIGTCCVDAMRNNVCRGGTGSTTIPHSKPDYAYCSYYPCDNSTGSCGAAAVASSTPPVYEKLGVLPNPEAGSCLASCHETPHFGQSCLNEAITPPSCDENKCTGFNCLNEDGKGPAAPRTCGTCCCNPDQTGDNDQCRKINSNLSCIRDKGNCTGQKRGLCCGCTSDSNCGSANTIGCGSDTCCQARPKVVDPTVPANKAENVCRNALIQATFDQLMQINTFSGNVIVAGDYGTSQCPAATTYLTAAYRPTFFAKIKLWLAKLPVINRLLIKEVQAVQTAPLTGNFCAIRGTVSGHNTADNKKTVLEFKPQGVLEANRKYYVIIKGDSDTSDAVKEGVLSLNGVGMKGDSSTFNGVTYSGKVWYFTTKASTADHNGICQLAAVSISPTSYLFNTRDGKKEFIAIASSTDGQAIAPIAGTYNWRWNWAIDDQAVVKFKAGESATDDVPQHTLVAQNVQDANTLLHAKATITEDSVSAGTVGASQEGVAQLYVFLCANPWPAVKTDGTWAPWQDSLKCDDNSGSCDPSAKVDDTCGSEGHGHCISNCTAGTSGACSNTNFALYYCRDAGGTGTADDLPAILSDKAIIRGEDLKCSDGSGDCLGKNRGATCSDGSGTCEGNLRCSDGSGSCIGNHLDGACGVGGTCGVDILKEFYFFREELPNLASGFKVSALPEGSKVKAQWDSVADAVGYKLYYGTASGKYSNSIDIKGGTITSQTVEGLTNNKTYYFAMASYNSQAVESTYSDEKSVTPADALAPNPPASLQVTAVAAATAGLSWPDTDEAASYKVYYGATSGSYGTMINVDKKSKCSDAVCNLNISNLNEGITYFFAVTALDDAKPQPNESNKMEGSLFIPLPAPPKNLEVAATTTAMAIISWTANKDFTVSYKIYYGTSNDALDNVIKTDRSQCSSTVCSTTISGLRPSATYYFAVSALDDAKPQPKESAKSGVKNLTMSLTDVGRCRADLINILIAIGLKRDQNQTNLMGVTGTGCSACYCRTWSIPGHSYSYTPQSPECADSMRVAFKKLGFTDLLRDPWGNPYLIDENEGEFSQTPCYADSLYSANPACGGITVPFYSASCNN